MLINDLFSTALDGWKIMVFMNRRTFGRKIS
jgi:hypothetical protein